LAGIARKSPIPTVPSPSASGGPMGLVSQAQVRRHLVGHVDVVEGNADPGDVVLDEREFMAAPAHADAATNRAARLVSLSVGLSPFFDGTEAERRREAGQDSEAFRVDFAPTWK
jgi:hypothetical protein